jgi:type I restriction enzyme S subunit
LIANGKTTSGLNTISTGNVKAVDLPIPPLPLQSAFSEQVHRIEATAGVLDGAATKAHAIEAALAAEVFGEPSHANPDKQPMAAE